MYFCEETLGVKAPTRNILIQEATNVEIVF